MEQDGVQAGLGPRPGEKLREEKEEGEAQKPHQGKEAGQGIEVGLQRQAPVAPQGVVQEEDEEGPQGEEEEEGEGEVGGGRAEEEGRGVEQKPQHPRGQAACLNGPLHAPPPQGRPPRGGTA